MYIKVSNVTDTLYFLVSAVVLLVITENKKIQNLGGRSSGLSFGTNFLENQHNFTILKESHRYRMDFVSVLSPGADI
jgi:hypothetical protein